MKLAHDNAGSPGVRPKGFLSRCFLQVTGQAAGPPRTDNAEADGSIPSSPTKDLLEGRFGVAESRLNSAKRLPPAMTSRGENRRQTARRQPSATACGDDRQIDTRARSPSCRSRRRTHRSQARDPATTGDGTSRTSGPVPRTAPRLVRLEFPLVAKYGPWGVPEKFSPMRLRGAVRCEAGSWRLCPALARRRCG
jgi:hypothetical protein